MVLTLTLPTSGVNIVNNFVVPNQNSEHNSFIHHLVVPNLIALMFKDGNTHHGWRLLDPCNQAVLKHVVPQPQANHNMGLCFLQLGYMTIFAFVCRSLFIVFFLICSELLSDQQLLFFHILLCEHW